MPERAVQDTEQCKEDPIRRQIRQMIAAKENGGYKNGDIDILTP